ncbi:hypothetical protein ACO0QE_000357 [Hanseniaspora vineae]
MRKSRKTTVTVCNPCRSRKIKCDRKKPSCTRCEESGVTCAYGRVNQVSPQQLPSIYDQALLLESQQNSSAQSSHSSPTLPSLHTYKMQPPLLPLPQISRQINTQTPGSYSVSSNQTDATTLNINSVSSASTYDSSSSKMSSNSGEHVHITIKDYPKPVVMIMEDSKFFSEPSVVFAFGHKDPFLKALAGSVYGIANMEYRLGNNQGVKEWLESIKFTEGDVKEISMLKFVDKIIKRNEQNSKRSKPEMWTPSILFWNDFKLPNELSDGVLPPFLVTLLNEVENAIPEVTLVQELLQHFYDVIYPVHPYLNLPSFKNTIAEVLIADEDLYKVKIGSRDIRKKVITLALLLIILRVSHLSIHVSNDVYLKEKFAAAKTITGTIVVLAQKLYSLLNTMETSNEDGLVFLLYLNMSEVCDPENEHVCLLQKERLILNSMRDYTAFLGLQKDMNTFPHIAALKDFDDNYIFQRKKLYVGGTFWRLNRLLPDGYGNIQEILDVEQFIQQKHGIIVDPAYNFMFRKLRYYLMLLKLNNVANNEINVPLKDFKKLLTNCENMLAKEFSLGQLAEQSSTSDKQFACEIIALNITGRICVLNQTFLLMIYFEDKVSFDPFEFSEYQMEFMLDSFRIIVELLGMITKYLEGKYDVYVPKAQAYMLRPAISEALLKCWVFLVAMIVRFKYCKKNLEALLISQSMFYQTSSSNNSRNGENAKKVLIQKLKLLTNNCTELLRFSVHLSAETIAKSHYSCYESTCVFGYIVQLLDMKKLTEATERFWTLLNFVPPEIINRIQLKWGIEISETTVILSKLENSNVLNNIDENVVESMHRILSDVDFSYKNINLPTPYISDNSAIAQFLQNDLDEYFDFWDDNLPALINPKV